MINELFFNSPKRTYALLMIAGIGMMAIALFMENVLILKPCMLCYLQRFFTILLGLIGFVGFVHNPTKVNTFKVYLITALLSALLGACFSLRQLYLQNLPADLVPSCAPDIGYLIDSLPFVEVLMMAIQGDGNCAEVMWSFLGISIPGWTLIAFGVMAIWLLRSLWLANEIHSQKLLR